MAISVAAVYLYDEYTYAGIPLRQANLNITGLVLNSVNTVPHGLQNIQGNAGVTPLISSIKPTSNNNFWNSSPDDSTNFYIGVGTLAGTTCQEQVTY